jgi:hypothetical protein
MADPITPTLADLQLTGAQVIRTEQQRAIAEHKIPGMAGSVLQDMGRPSAVIQVDGYLFGDSAADNLESLRKTFKDAKPVPFTADIMTATDIVDVMIADVDVVAVAGRPNLFQFSIVLKESPPPPPPANPFAAVDLGALSDAQSLFDQAVGLTDLVSNLGNIPNFSDPTPPLNSMIDGVSSATSGLTSGLASLASLFGG